MLFYIVGYLLHIVYAKYFFQIKKEGEIVCIKKSIFAIDKDMGNKNIQIM